MIYVLLFACLATANTTLKNLSPDSWWQAPGTRMADVCPPPSTYPYIQGAVGCTAVTSAWSGGAIDSVNGKMYVWGGGHNDYYGNEIYSFDIELLTWARVTSPTTVPTLDYDPYSDGNPGARHTYDGLAYIAHANRFFAYGGSKAGPSGNGTEVTWTYDPWGNKWTNMNPSGSLRPTTNCCNFSSAYDLVSGKVFMRDPNYLYSYTYSTNTWSRLINWVHEWGPNNMEVDGRRRILFTAGNGEWFAYDIASGANVTSSWATTGGSAFIGGYGVGLAYDPRRDRMYGYIGGAVWVLDMKTKVWSRGSSTGSPASQETFGTYGRFAYYPKDDVFLLVNRAGENVWFYKPSSMPDSTVSSEQDAMTAVKMRLSKSMDSLWYDFRGKASQIMDRAFMVR